MLVAAGGLLSWSLSPEGAGLSAMWRGIRGAIYRYGDVRDCRLVRWATIGERQRVEAKAA